MHYKIISLLLLTSLIQQLNCSTETTTQIVAPTKISQKNYDVLSQAVPVPALQAIIMGYLDSWDKHVVIAAPTGSKSRGFAFLAEDKRIAIIYFPTEHSQTIRILDTETGKEIERLDQTDYDRMWSIHYAPKANRLAISFTNFRLKLYDFAKREYRIVRKKFDAIFPANWSTNEKQVAFQAEQSNDRIKILDLQTEAETLLPATYSKIAYSPDGNHMALAQQDVILISELKTGKIIYTFKHAPTRQISYSPDGKFLAANTASGGPITIWDMTSGSILRTINIPSYNNDMNEFAFSPDSTSIATGYQLPRSYAHVLTIFDVLTGVEGAQLTSELNGTHEVAFSANGMYLAAKAEDSGKWKNHGVQIWANTAKAIEQANSKAATK